MVGSRLNVCARLALGIHQMGEVGGKRGRIRGATGKDVVEPKALMKALVAP
jgi:hypothetical protein